MLEKPALLTHQILISRQGCRGKACDATGARVFKTGCRFFLNVGQKQLFNLVLKCCEADTQSFGGF